MDVERHFLGWDAPVTEKVREFLLPGELSVPVDLGDQLIVVPTRQAGRRLRESLSLYCARQHTALLSPRVVTPTFFLRADEEATSTASQTEVAAAWATVLMEANPGDYRGLFPGQAPARDFVWAMNTGETIQRLRETLVDGGCLIADVQREFGDILEEPERWRDLAKLEKTYLDRLEERDRQDPFDLMIKRSEEPGLPEGIQRIVVAAVPDPTPLMIRALEYLAKEVPVLILVHAPPSLEDRFDEWGRPIAEKWDGSIIEVPDPEANIILSGSPASQCGKVLELIEAESGRFGPTDIAIGVPDSGVTPFLAVAMDSRGLYTFDPAGKKLTEHPLYGLLESYRRLVNEGTYVSVGSFLRRADVLACLEKVHGLPPRPVLEELDEFQNECLPVGLEDITGRFSGREGERSCRKFGSLEKAVGFAREQVEAFEEGNFDGVVRAFLQAVYAMRAVNPGNPVDDEFMEVAGLVDAALRELVVALADEAGITKKDGLDLLLKRMSTQSYYPERKDAVVDLEGWLELPWNDAPFLIVTGMNEGFVPDSRLGDIFLPDSLRSQLKLRCDADRLARDAYLMKGLIESRRQEGRVCFIAGKTSAPGNPLKPSRLLFRCADEELPRRAGRLFGDTGEKHPNFPSSISFSLDARPPADLPAGRLKVEAMPVTRFKDYLACPFRFYLKYILGMEELDDLKTEMDPRDFGSMVHYALHRMAKDDKMRVCTDPGELQKFLRAKAEGWVRRHFGSSPSLSVLIQLVAAQQRLGAAARVQAGLAGEGWEILRAEMPIEAGLDGMLIRGKIDRVDRNRETGRIRILDYKTSDKEEKPEIIHIGTPSPGAADYTRITVKGKEKRWIDLQLPLYRILLAETGEFDGPLEIGYFNMPKAVNDTRITTWKGFGDKLLKSAGICAAGVIGDVRNLKFWPASEKVRYEEFKCLFHDDISRCVDGESFEKFMEAERKA